MTLKKHIIPHIICTSQINITEVKQLELVLLLSVAKLCPTLYDPVDCSTPGFPVFHCFLEFAQIHVYSVGDVISPSHPLLPSSPFAFNLSQHGGLFQ